MMKEHASPDIHVGLFQAEKIYFHLEDRYRVKGVEGGTAVPGGFE